MSSTEIYLPYYSPTDVPNQNKVKYTVDVGSDTSLIITSNNGFVNLNRINVYDRNYINDETTDLGTGINDYLYTVMKTQGYKFGQVNLQNSGLPAYVGSPRELNNTITKQLSIDNFDYNYIYGLPTAKQQVIDWNYFVNMENVGAKNIFGQNSSNTSIRLNNKVTNVKLGPRLFYYNSNTEQNVGYRGAGFQTNIGTASTVKNIVDSVNGLTGISNYYGLTINDVQINATTNLQTLEYAWPYKVQPASDQYYQMITNGIETGLLTIPHEPTANQTSYYMLSIGNNNSDQVIQYSKLDDIVENNYYYITSYFDARPTIQANTNLYFPSTCASLFNENLVQVLPLMPFYITMPDLLHTGYASNIANVNPVCYTTFNQGTIYNMYQNTINNGSQPTTVIPLKWDKNITITTQLNFTCANLTNLSNILTGWNYLRKDFSNSSNIISRANLPYVNVGVILYFPSQNSNFAFIKDGAKNTNNKYNRFINWLDSFTNDNPFYESVVDNSYNHEDINNDILNQIYSYTYNNIETETGTNKVKYSTFSNASNVACINFNRSAYGDPYSDKLNLFDQNNTIENFISGGTNTTNQFVPPFSPTNTNYQDNLQDAQTDIIKFYTTLSIPITNALNTTYSMNDTCTFCFAKNGSIKTTENGTSQYIGTTYLADRYYIIGTFMYITRSLPTSDIRNNPHYIGFAPSTNIASMDLLSDTGAGSVNQLYNYPASISSSFVTDTSNPLSNSYSRGSNPMKNPIMKDMFATPSLFMTINESVNNI